MDFDFTKLVIFRKNNLIFDISIGYIRTRIDFVRNLKFGSEKSSLQKRCEFCRNMDKHKEIILLL
jgi:hypothetical protein